jgi:hypothetical protein
MPSLIPPLYWHHPHVPLRTPPVRETAPSEDISVPTNAPANLPGSIWIYLDQSFMYEHYNNGVGQLWDPDSPPATRWFNIMSDKSIEKQPEKELSIPIPSEEEWECNAYSGT